MWPSRNTSGETGLTNAWTRRVAQSEFSGAAVSIMRRPRVKRSVRPERLQDITVLHAEATWDA